jgi:hypothetical protein
MSYDQPDFQHELVFMDHSDQNPVFPHNVSRCIDPGMMDLLTVDDFSRSPFPSPQFPQFPQFTTEQSPVNPPPPESTSSESDDMGHSYDIDGLMSPISRRGSADAWPSPEREVPKRQSSAREARRHDSVSGEGHKRRPRKRVPHNLVERKYRNTLNAEMERLRSAIPHVARISSGGDTEAGGGGGAKLSKANVLACALEYIQSMEAECNRLKRRNNELQAGLDVSLRRERLP